MIHKWGILTLDAKELGVSDFLTLMYKSCYKFFGQQ